MQFPCLQYRRRSSYEPQSRIRKHPSNGFYISQRFCATSSIVNGRRKYYVCLIIRARVHILYGQLPHISLLRRVNR